MDLDTPRNGGRLTERQKLEIVDRYLAGESQTALAQTYGCQRTNILYLLRRRGVPIRRPGYQVDAELDERIRVMRAERMTVREIAAATGESKHRILTRSRALGLSERKMPRGPKNPAWKGGSFYRQHTGYMYRMVEPDDPMRAMAHSNGYVPEHRLVMARSLGRPLTAHETVHHINGDRTDNRLENLQLRTGQHGKGVVMACHDCGSHNVGGVRISD